MRDVMAVAAAHHHEHHAHATSGDGVTSGAGYWYADEDEYGEHGKRNTDVVLEHVATHGQLAFGCTLALAG